MKLFYISLPRWSDINTLCTVVDRKRFCVFRVDHWVQKSGLPPLPYAFLLLPRSHRFRWSRGSVLAFGTQVHGFKPGRSSRIFQGEKIVSTLSFGGEVKPSVPCRRFAACKRSPKKTWKSLLSAKFVGHFSPNSSTSRYLDLWRRCDVRDTWRCGLEPLKTKGLQ